MNVATVLLHWRKVALVSEGGAMVSARRDLRAARRFFATALRLHGEPVEVVTDRAPALRAAIEDLIPGAFHNTEQYANNRVECDHGRLKARLRPMRGLKRDQTARVIMRGHALMQNIRRGHYELGCGARTHRRVAAGGIDPVGSMSPTSTSGAGSVFARRNRSHGGTIPML